MSQIIKFKRGLKSRLSLLDHGELAFCTDTMEMFIGSPTGNALIGKAVSNLQNVTLSPTKITLKAGESQYIVVNTIPSTYGSFITNEFESGNTGFLTVDSAGLVTAVYQGQTYVKVTSTYGNQAFTNIVNAVVNSPNEPIPSSNTRVITGVAFNKTIDSVEVGEHFSVMATTLPFDVLYENLIIWETSDPTVCTVNYGVLQGLKPGTVTITAYDITRTFSDSFTMTVTPVVVQTFTPSEIHDVTATSYGLYLDNSHSTETTNGIINALNFASANGYKKIVFPYGTYLVTPVAGTVNFPTNLVVDFRGSRINIEPSSLSGSTGYVMFRMDKVEYTKLLNAHVFGDADTYTLDTSVESCISLLIGDCYKSGFDNCTFSKSPGFNVITSTNLVKDGTGDNVFSYENFETGSIDDGGNNDDSVTDYHFRSIDFVDISTLGDYYMVGYNQGYWDFGYLRSRLYSIYFYDVNYSFISVQHYNWQYYCYDKPQNASYVKIVVYQVSVPTDGDSDFGGATAFIRTIGIPRRCFIKNSTFENNFSTGLAMCGGQDWTITGNTFGGNWGRAPSCDIDWEDGWDAMVGDIVKNNIFNSTFAITVSAGANISIFNNTFNKAGMDVWSRSQNWRIFNNTWNGKAGNVGQFDIALGAAGDSYFVGNTLKGIRISSQDKNDPDGAYSIHTSGNILM
jgi:hypothetical protein